MNSFLVLGNDGKVQWLKASLATFITPRRHPRARGTSEPEISFLNDIADDIFSNCLATTAIYQAIIKNY
ncbi:hypothetical protein EDB39_1013 [Vibrio crassostreae]|nr:hypothetical protein EDB56_101373 [Vibrio crassostreae]ROO64494.1 hypothetical protein EDB58_102387 [Vibrio crassostreae]ROO74965.1 hypothetical protein EDB57_1405 [Vibrio crassostreae]ROO77559.1 hypothetical protein EDB53_1396 [Vibrio crassostreae]ROP25478.1 hypothetical protein EDB33_101562 [Vibrio crassostreae]